jgi:DNA-binding NarL/FixJ family response regulator
MDVLIIERDELVRSLLAETLDAEGITATGAAHEEALKLLSNDAPQEVITGINGGHDEDEDLTRLKLFECRRVAAAEMRRCSPSLLTPAPF